MFQIIVQPSKPGNSKKKKPALDDAEETGTGRKGKVTESSFNDQPSVKSFAVLAKAYFRKQAAFGAAFPPRPPVERNAFILKMLHDCAEEATSDTANEEDYVELVERLSSESGQAFDNLCSFVGDMASDRIAELFFH
jgi:hypothetical protein